jgi:hypothetical protein
MMHLRQKSFAHANENVATVKEQSSLHVRGFMAGLEYYSASSDSCPELIRARCRSPYDKPAAHDSMDVITSNSA